jgi:hypothetical protein
MSALTTTSIHDNDEDQDAFKKKLKITISLISVDIKKILVIPPSTLNFFVAVNNLELEHYDVSTVRNPLPFKPAVPMKPQVETVVKESDALDASSQ